MLVKKRCVVSSSRPRAPRTALQFLFLLCVAGVRSRSKTDEEGKASGTPSGPATSLAAKPSKRAAKSLAVVTLNTQAFNGLQGAVEDVDAAGAQTSQLQAEYLSLVCLYRYLAHRDRMNPMFLSRNYRCAVCSVNPCCPSFGCHGFCVATLRHCPGSAIHATHRLCAPYCRLRRSS